MVCNNTINALFVSLLYLNVFDIFRFKVFYWVYESYFLKKEKIERHFANKLETKITVKFKKIKTYDHFR